MGGSIQRSIYQGLTQAKIDSTSPRKHFPQIYRAEDEERRLLPKRQAAGWRNERKVQKKDRLQRSQTISHRLLFLTVCMTR